MVAADTVVDVLLLTSVSAPMVSQDPDAPLVCIFIYTFNPLSLTMELFWLVNLILLSLFQ